MNELDFDELDKAVNSLMTGMSTEKRNTALDDPEDKVVSLDMSETSASPVSSPVQSGAQPAAAPEATPVISAPSAPRPAQPLAVKRRGQFMDMVHPSSDMKTVAPAPRREGVSVQPSSPFVPPALNQFGAGEAGTELKPEPVAPVLDVVTPAATPAPELPSEQKVEEASSTSEWPDPIDLASNSSVPTETVPETEVPADVVSEVAAPAQDEPLVSPFLPDAKVEKRPLGGSATETTGEAEPASTDVPETQLPDELKTDVMALESTSTGGSQTITEATSPPESAPTESQAPVANTAPKEASVAGGGSIPQQYTESPSTSKQTNTPIYDTSTHQPLAGAAKKSSPVKWIILALVLLIIGAIAGAAYFYFTTHRI